MTLRQGGHTYLGSQGGGELGIESTSNSESLRSEPLRQLDELQDVVDLAELGEERLDTRLLDRLRTVEQLAGQRLARSREHVVVALAGGTGSGKSSLLNALLGRDVSSPGVKRPTTDHAVAVSVGAGEEEARLLDWLQVFERHRLEVEGDLEDMAGAVILDLPDVDSVVAAHWDTAERLMERCDLLVWVLDPLKYARALTHRHYLANLAHHAEVLVVALNHADRLAPSGRAECMQHLEQLLKDNGLVNARTIATSASSGEGVDLLRQIIGEEVRERRAPIERLRADARAVKEQVAQVLPAAEWFYIDKAQLVKIQHESLNERDLRNAAAAIYRRKAIQVTSSPLQRLVVEGSRRLWRAIFAGRKKEHAGQTARPEVKIASNQLRYGMVDAVDHIVQRSPVPASKRLRAAASESAQPLAEELRKALADLSLEPRKRWWWVVVALLRGGIELSAVVGGGWLVARSVADWLVLPPIPVPMFVGELGWPPVLIFTGISGSALIGFAARPLIAMGAKHQGSLVRGQIAERIEEVAESRIGQIDAELERCRQISSLAHKDAG